MTRARISCFLLSLAVFGACAEPESPTAPPRGLAPGGRASTAVATLTVVNTNDDGPGSLRAAIASAQGGDLIQFAAAVAGQTITLTSGALDVAKPITIEGPATGVTIDGGGASKVAFVRSAVANVALRNLTITGGHTSEFGGGIENYGSLTLDHVLVTGNTVENGVKTFGGGVYNGPGANLILVNSTVSGNHAASLGGGIATEAPVLLRNSTVTGNTASSGGGVASLTASGVSRLRNAIVAGNTAGTGANCGDAVHQTYDGNNISNDDSCGTDASMLIADAKLGLLAANDGPTKTHALLTDSPAIDAGIDCQLSDDQRHVARPQGAACDIGAFEFNDYAKLALTIDASAVGLVGSSAAVVSGSVTCSAPGMLELAVTLSQPQKVGRVNTTVDAKGVLTLDCSGKKFWSIALKPASGGFENGVAAVTVTTGAIPRNFLPATLSAPVKVFWGKK